jgi:hypothetical protein
VGSGFDHIHHDKSQLTIPLRRRLMVEITDLGMLILEAVDSIHHTPPTQRVPGPALILEFASAKGGPNENG